MEFISTLSQQEELEDHGSDSCLRLLAAIVATEEMYAKMRTAAFFQSLSRLRVGQWSEFFSSDAHFLFAAGLSLSVATDILITTSYCVYLRRARKGVHSASIKSLLDILMVNTLETGILTCLIAVAALIFVRACRYRHRLVSSCAVACISFDHNISQPAFHPGETLPKLVARPPTPNCPSKSAQRQRRLPPNELPQYTSTDSDSGKIPVRSVLSAQFASFGSRGILETVYPEPSIPSVLFNPSYRTCRISVSFSQQARLKPSPSLLYILTWVSILFSTVILVASIVDLGLWMALSAATVTLL
ncbi:hypothetical protein MKEN_00623400 [Mycena kentingensis (nom. inval.)]|nr:hypothetical protein MKEN_00623400 [Mycena kentingensis (nom. inval.)]